MKSKQKKPFTMEQKRAKAIAYLRSRGLYILDKGTPPPSWASKVQQRAQA